MTSKELLYLEDALGHEKYFQSKCKETASQLQEMQLKTCSSKWQQKHQQFFSVSMAYCKGGHKHG